MNFKLFFILALSLPLSSHAKVKTELTNYIKLTQEMKDQLVILKEAGKCGNIGSKVADSMDKSIDELKTHKQQVTEAAKKGSAGKSELEQAVSSAEEDFHQIDGHKGMVLWGLDGDKPECVTATKAFTTLHAVIARIPDQIRKVSASL